MAGLNNKKNPTSILAVDDQEDNLYIIRILVEEFLRMLNHDLLRPGKRPGNGICPPAPWYFVGFKNARD